MEVDEEREAERSLLLTPRETAAQLRVSRTTVFALLKAGEIPSVLLGPQIRRIPRAGLVEYIERKMAEVR